MNPLELTYRRPSRCAICKKEPPVIDGYWRKYACQKCINKFNRRKLQKEAIQAGIALIFFVALTSLVYYLGILQ
jgi:hypothetical protein